MNLPDYDWGADIEANRRPITVPDGMTSSNTTETAAAGAATPIVFHPRTIRGRCVYVTPEWPDTPVVQIFASAGNEAARAAKRQFRAGAEFAAACTPERLQALETVLRRGMGYSSVAKRLVDELLTALRAATARATTATGEGGGEGV